MSLERTMCLEKLKFIDLGGGFGINYSNHKQLINFNNYAKLVLDFKKKTK